MNLFPALRACRAHGILAVLAAVSLSQAAQAQTWPTLQQQLAKDRIATGSALARLIAENQDFSMLRPEESKDLIRIPAWLRVYWRKTHPEAVYAADDPTGGYPFVAKEVYEWMVSHQDLLPGAPDPTEPPGAKSSVGANVSVSGTQPAPRSESDIRINYWDPTKVVCASNNIASSGFQAQYWSTDGGVTWGRTTLTAAGTGDTSHSDPTVDWTSDGKAYSTTLGIVGSTLRGRAYVSADSGATWTLDGTYTGSHTNVDKQMAWVDHSAMKADGVTPNPYKDNIYVIYHNGTPAYMNRRTAAGWQTPVQVNGAESTGTCIGSDVKTNQDGEVFGFWPTTTNRKILVVKSTDGGATYGTPVQIATTYDGYDIGVPSFNSRRALIYVSGGAYKTASKNLVYASWVDLSGDTGCTAAANEPGSSVASTCKTRVWFSRSLDGGATWTAPVRINHQAGLNDQFNQWLAVDETTGVLSIMYSDTVDDATRKASHIYYQNSTDDGATWGTPVKITTASTDETTAGADSGNQYGDYNGMSAYAGVFFPVWTDRRAGGMEQIWTAKVTECTTGFPGAPTIGTATSAGANQIQVTWAAGAPAGATYTVYRALGTCAAPGAYSEIATGVVGTSYLDTTAQGLVTYSYKVKASDSPSCVSGFSGCTEGSTTGTCTLAPSFAGATSVTNDALSTCQLSVAFPAASAYCGGPVTFNVYRSTTSGFVPGPANLIATGVTASPYVDSSPMPNGVTQYYVVRAVDGANSQEETNAVEKGAAPTGPIAVGTLTETFEDVADGFDVPGWATTTPSGTNVWTWVTAQSQTPTHSWYSQSQTSASDRILTSPSFGIQATTTLSFWHTYALENSTSTPTTCFDGATLEISTNGGGTWTVVPDANFTAGLFNGTVSSSFSNPLGGRRAWCGNTTIGAFTQVTVNLSSYAGATNAQVRWHAGDDSSVARIGWYVDSVTLTNAGVPGTCNASPVELLSFDIE